MLQRTPLYELCQAASGRMVPFSGWEMPLQFSGLLKEHQAVRNSAGLFDISHMGILKLEGKHPKESLQALVPTDLNRIGPGEACYTVFLNENGGILDDLIVYDLGDSSLNKQSLLLVINASRYVSDKHWLETHLPQEQISISDAKANNIFMALQGPKAKLLLEDLIQSSLTSIPRFGHRQIQLKEWDSPEMHPSFIARTGYTGEEGFEMLLPVENGKKLWLQLIDQGAKPCGLGARDTLRLEAAMHLYGNDINQKTTPFEAGLGWLVHLEMPSKFIGRRALEKQAEEGVQRRLIGLQLNDREIARNGYPIMHEDKIVGAITSGSWSPTLNKAIALAYVPIKLAKIGGYLEVEIRGKKHVAQVVKKPFYRKFD